jgi:hypothetical protein
MVIFAFSILYTQRRFFNRKSTFFGLGWAGNIQVISASLGVVLLLCLCILLLQCELLHYLGLFHLNLVEPLINVLLTPFFFCFKDRRLLLDEILLTMATAPTYAPMMLVTIRSLLESRI